MNKHIIDDYKNTKIVIGHKKMNVDNFDDMLSSDEDLKKKMEEIDKKLEKY